MTDGPWHPREPSPLEMALLLANPWTYLNLALATSIWAPGAAVRAWKRVCG